MSVVLILALGVISLLVGILIGCIGIGGVIMVPALTYLAGMQVQVAIASSMLSFLFTGILGAALYARRGSLQWSMTGWLCAAAMPGAYLGAVTVAVASATLLQLIIAALILFAGVDALRSVGTHEPRTTPLGNLPLAFIGGLTGFGSALTGTGGPIILVPILIWLRLPVLTAIGLSQIIQVPIGSLATIGNFTYGHVNVPVGIGVAVILMAGVAVGVRIAHAVPAHSLKRAVAVVLILIGVLIVTRIGLQSLTPAATP